MKAGEMKKQCATVYARGGGGGGGWGFLLWALI